MARIIGTDKVVRNLNTEVLKIIGRSKAGVLRAARIVRNESVRNTPVDTGNLRASSYVISADGPKGPGAEIGYTAAYAPFVHEIDKAYTVGSWKFLENALADKRVAMLEEIRRSVSIK